MTSLVSTGQEVTRGITPTRALIESHATAGRAVSAGRGRELRGETSFQIVPDLQNRVSQGQCCVRQSRLEQLSSSFLSVPPVSV